MDLSIVKKYLKDLLPKSSFDKLYNHGVDEYDNGNYEKAIEYFKEAINQKSIKPQVYYNIGLTYQKMKNYDRAVTAYQSFLLLRPKDYDGLFNIGLVHFEKENYQKSIEYFKQSLEIKEEVENVKAITLAYLSCNQIEDAKAFANNYLLKDKIKLYYAIAQVFENKNSFSRNFELLNYSIEMYSKIIEIVPDFFKAYLSKSICYAKKGELENSVEYCKQALQRNPNSYEANNQMGLVYYCCEKTEDAITYYEKAFELNPDDYKIYSNLAYAYEKTGKTSEAVKIFEKMIKKFPNFPAKDEIKQHIVYIKSL